MPSKLSGASEASIQSHYDVNNDFFQIWLDSTMSYSCALWEGEDSLFKAQENKLQFHIEKAHAQNASRVLDIGCGWGGLLQMLQSTYKVAQPVGLTLSKQQYNWIQEKDWPGVEVRLENWQNHHPNQLYDAIISIGAFEHFAQLGLSREERVKIYRRFFLSCHEWLKPGAYLSLQTIGCGNMLREDFSAFFANSVFPESDLPRLGEILDAAECLFEVVQLRNDRQDYAKTLKVWRQRLKAQWHLALTTASEDTVQRFERYFGLAIIGFGVLGSMNLYRISFKRIDKPRSTSIPIY